MVRAILYEDREGRCTVGVTRVEGIILTPSPDLVVTELGASSVNMNVRIWIADASREQPVCYRVMEASKIALDQAGIEIPYHHLQLFLEKIDERVWHQAAKFASFSKSSAVSGTADLRLEPASRISSMQLIDIGRTLSPLRRWPLSHRLQTRRERPPVTWLRQNGISGVFGMLHQPRGTTPADR